MGGTIVPALSPDVKPAYRRLLDRQKIDNPSAEYWFARHRRRGYFHPRRRSPALPGPRPPSIEHSVVRLQGVEPMAVLP
jgi:hypothetical protein